MFQNIRFVFLLIVFTPVLLWAEWQEARDEEIKEMYES